MDSKSRHTHHRLCSARQNLRTVIALYILPAVEGEYICIHRYALFLFVEHEFYQHVLVRMLRVTEEYKLHITCHRCYLPY